MRDPEAAATGQPGGPLLVIVSGPSGVGKDSVLRVMRCAGWRCEFVVTATTRPRRAGESDGVDYVFLNEAAFGRLREEGGLLECSRVYGYWYGVPRSPVEEALAAGRDVVLKTDVQGVQKLRQVVAGAVTIFLAPPTMDALEGRLRARMTESRDRLELRLATARSEMLHLPRFDYAVVNEEERLEETVSRIGAIMEAERYRMPPRRVELL